jgi:hypothetical protein
MDVTLNTEALNSLARTAGVAPKPTSGSAPKADASFKQSESLNQTLDVLPPLRVGEVERAKGLVSSEHYPPLETMRRLARLLAITDDSSQ